MRWDIFPIILMIPHSYGKLTSTGYLRPAPAPVGSAAAPGFRGAANVAVLRWRAVPETATAQGQGRQRGKEQILMVGSTMNFRGFMGIFADLVGDLVGIFSCASGEN